MSDPKRYDLVDKHYGYFLCHKIEGEWVKWEDYARLKAEVERLNKQAAYICASEETKAENAKLKADVERLEMDVWRMKVFKGIDEDTNATLKDALNTVPEWAKVLETEAENARLKAEVERLNTGIQPEGSNDAVGRAVNVLLEKEKEIARLKAEVEHLQSENLLVREEADRYCRLWQEAKEGKQS